MVGVRFKVRVGARVRTRFRITKKDVVEKTTRRKKKNSIEYIVEKVGRGLGLGLKLGF